MLRVEGVTVVVGAANAGKGRPTSGCFSGSESSAFRPLSSTAVEQMGKLDPGRSIARE